MSLKNLQVLIHTKLHEKSCCYLTIIYMKKHHRKLRQTKFCQRALFAICTCVTTLHSCYMRNALAFSLSEARNFFLYIIKVLMSSLVSLYPVWTVSSRLNTERTWELVWNLTIDWGVELKHGGQVEVKYNLSMH